MRNIGVLGKLDIPFTFVPIPVVRNAICLIRRPKSNKSSLEMAAKIVVKAPPYTYTPS